MPLVGSLTWARYLTEEKKLPMLGNERLQRLWALRSKVLEDLSKDDVRVLLRICGQEG